MLKLSIIKDYIFLIIPVDVDVIAFVFCACCGEVAK